MSAKDSSNQITETEVRSLLLEADASSRAGMVGDAGRQYSQILTLLEGDEEVWQAETAYCLQRIGDLSWFSGRYDEAEQAYKKLLVIAEKTLGGDHPDLTEIRNHLAQIKDMHENADAAAAGKEDLFDNEQVVPAFQRSSHRQASLPSTGRKLPRSAVVLIVIAAGLGLLLIPDNAAACLSFLGSLSSNAEHYPAALRAYNLAHKIKPKSSEIMYKRAWVNVKLHNLQRAVDDFSFVIAKDPKYAAAYFGRGVSRSDLKDYETAVGDFDQFIALQPKNAAAYVRRGIAKAKIGRYEQAVKDYDEANKLDPTNAEALYNRGWALELQYDEAMENEDVPPVVALAPTQATAEVKHPGAEVTNATTASANPGKPQEQKPAMADQSRSMVAEKKLEQLNAVIKTAPTAEHYCERGWTWLSLNKLKQSVADFDQAIKLNDKYARAYLDRGLAYYKLNQLKPAIKDYSQSIVIDEKNASAYYRRGLAFHKQGQYALSASDYQQAGRLNPAQAKQYALLAKADLNRIKKDVAPGEQKNAEAAGKQPVVSGQTLVVPAALPAVSTKDDAAGGSSAAHNANQTNPAGAAASAQADQPQLSGSKESGNRAAQRHHNRASRLVQEKQYQEAVNECLAAIACNPSPPMLANIYRDTGACYEQTGNHELAWQYINKSLGIAPDNAPSLAYRGLLWLQRGDTEKALADANAAISVNANCVNAHVVKWRTYRTMGKFDLAKQERERAQELQQQRQTGQ